MVLMRVNESGQNKLLTFYNFPPEHLQSLSTNQSDRIDDCHHTASHETLKRMSESRRHALHNVQAGNMRQGELAPNAWI